MAWSPDGSRLASAAADGTVKVWDARTLQEELTLKDHTDAVWDVAFSPDGRRLASASDDGTVKVWAVRTGPVPLPDKVVDPFAGPASATDGAGRVVVTLRGHTGGVWGVAWSRDGGLLASASQDRTVKVWDAQSGQELLTLAGHASCVTGVAFSPDGQRLASASWDGTVRVWAFPPP